MEQMNTSRYTCVYEILPKSSETWLIITLYCHFQSGHLLYLYSDSNDLATTENNAENRLKLGWVRLG